MTSFRPYLNPHTKRWQTIVELGRDEAGKRKQIFRTVARERNTRAEAKRVGRLLLNELEAASALEPTDMTVAELLRSWLSDQARHTVTPRTYARYRSIVELHLVPALGQMPLSTLQPLRVQELWARQLEAGLDPATVAKHHSVLRAALSHGVRMRLLAANPVSAVRPPKPHHREMRVLDEEGVARLLAAVKETTLHIPVLLALATGMRRGELLGLRWGDIDCVAGTLAVRQTLQEAAGKRLFKGPKTPGSRRVIALPTVALEALEHHRAEQDAARLRLGALYRDCDLVCAQGEGSPWWPSDFDRGFRRARRRAGLGETRFHDLRHTHATQLLVAGVHPKVVQERLGHANVGITLDTYSHVAPHMQEEAAQRIDAGLRRAMER